MSLGMTSTYGQSTVEIILRTVFRLRSTYLMLLTIHGLAVLRLQAKVEDSCFHIWYLFWGTVFTFFYFHLQDRTRKQCPYAVTMWQVYLGGGNFAIDPSLKVKCSTRKSILLCFAYLPFLARLHDYL